MPGDPDAGHTLLSSGAECPPFLRKISCSCASSMLDIKNHRLGDTATTRLSASGMQTYCKVTSPVFRFHVPLKLCFTGTSLSQFPNCFACQCFLGGSRNSTAPGCIGQSTSATQVLFQNSEACGNLHVWQGAACCISFHAALLPLP